MNPQIDFEQLENAYSKLQESLRSLSDLLVHTSDDAKVIEAFRVTGSTAMGLFRAEEAAMEAVNCPLLESNRMGHKKFLRDLGQVLHEARSDRTGIHAAGILRREVVPWLHEHHAVVDRQMILLRRRAEAAQQAV
jgi:hemerythrin